jgi:radical SAM protein with 4Fe4S-binding SPASM domain
MPELSLDLWRTVFERLWKTGVPQVVFTGGEPTMREDLVALVAEAEEFVTGLVTNGVRLADLADPLRDASLDYVQVTLESAAAEVHNRMVGDAAGRAFDATVAGIRKALDLKLQVVTNTTLTRASAPGFAALVRFAADLGLRHMSCNTLICSGRGTAARKDDGHAPEELRGVLQEALGTTTERGITLQWYSPTCYLHLNPVELGFGAKGCSAAAHNMTVLPDGSVLPCQSWPDTVGNILADPWPAIWNHPTCRKLRRHGFADENEDCRACVHNATCGGACPLEKEGAP